MARGKKLDTETIYKIMSSYAVTNNFSETSRELEIPITTVKQIVDANKSKDEFVKLSKQKKEQFADKATKIIEKALKRLESELDSETPIPINQLSTVIGTLYDKRALAQGDSTENATITVKMGEEMELWAK